MTAIELVGVCLSTRPSPAPGAGEMLLLVQMGTRVNPMEQSEKSVAQLAVAYVSPGPRDPIEWIDWMIDAAISKPRNFKDTPEELEAMLWAYDDVRTHLVTQSDSSQALHSYGNFLMTTECEAASYCVRQRLEGRLPAIEGLCDLWRAFIAWRIWQNSRPLSERAIPQNRLPGDPAVSSPGTGGQ